MTKNKIMTIQNKILNPKLNLNIKLNHHIRDNKCPMHNNNKHLNLIIKIITIKFKRRNNQIIINLRNNINNPIRMTIINKKIHSLKKTIFQPEIEKENRKNMKDKKNQKNINLLLNTNLH